MWAIACCFHVRKLTNAIHNEVIYEALIEVKGSLVQSSPMTPKRLFSDLSSCLLFDMRLLVFSFYRR